MESGRNWVLLDSGIGGLVYAQALKKAYPRANFTYVADTLNFPYGNKSRLALATLLNELLDLLEKKFFNIAGVFFVCNTATVNYLEGNVNGRSYPLSGVYPFIGYSQVLPPSRNTLLLSTQATYKSQLVQLYLNKFPQRLKAFPLPALVQFAETGKEKWSYVAQEEIMNLKNSLTEWTIEEIYLGCTHFIALKDWLTSYFKDSLFVDAQSYLVKMFGSYFNSNDTHEEGKADFYLSGPLKEASYYAYKAQEAGFCFQGSL